MNLKTHTPSPLENSEAELVAFQKAKKRYEPRAAMVVWVDGQKCVKIPLTQNQWTMIDFIDYENVGRFMWCAQRFGVSYFSARRRKNGKIVSLSRELIGVPGFEVDHINGDPLDNRRCNLRLATHAENQRNTGLRRNNSSGYKGVSFYKATKKWAAKIGRSHLGMFDTSRAAATAYDTAAISKDSSFSWTNLIKRESNSDTGKYWREGNPESSSESKG